jgi:tetratricopeptide (TPR) repeat protein
MGESSLRIFVAMPGSTMGEGAAWADIPEIKRTLLQAVARRLGEGLGRSVEIVIEKDKVGSAEIHPSMFREAVEADVYIADLSGANPNVYLELGVRWALRDGITVLISQDVGQGVPLPFNVSANRVLSYGPMPGELERAIDSIVASVLAALRDPGWIDSPVRTSVDLLTAPRSEWEGLRAQVRHLQELHADELVAAAKDVPPAKAIELLRRAVDRNPVSVEAHYQLGVVLRRAADYSGAISELSTVTELKADFAEGWRELGVALSKSGELARAEAAFNEAAELDPQDAETWSTLGGLRRRLARLSDDGKFDWAMLREARSAYQRASELKGNDTYSLVNVARLDLLLSAAAPSTRQAALTGLRRLQHLARFEAETAKQPGGDSEQKPWKVLDLADTLLLTGQVDEGLAELREAIDLIDPRSREAYLTSVIAPLQDFINVEVLDAPTAAGVMKAIEISRDAIDAVRPRKQGPRKADN